MKRYKIIEYDHDLFVPKVAECIFDYLFGFWYAIDSVGETWATKECIINYCTYKSYSDALRAINVYKTKTARKGFKTYRKKFTTHKVK